LANPITELAVIVDSWFDPSFLAPVRSNFIQAKVFPQQAEVQKKNSVNLCALRG